MAAGEARQQRRSDALSHERIVAASIELLDSVGEDGLTVRALTDHLATGRGALYHHVRGKEALLAAATNAIIGATVDGVEDPDPSRALRSLALGIFDTIAAHPWVGRQLGHQPLQPAVVRIWTAVGEQLARIGLTGRDRSAAGAALVNYVLGAAAQYSAGAGQPRVDASREAYLETVSAELTRLDPGAVAREIADQLPEHDDRAQFLAGVDLFLAGIRATHS